MGLEKAIEFKKERRKPYRDSRRFDPMCRNHNWCPICRGNRLHSFLKETERSRTALKDFLESAE